MRKERRKKDKSGKKTMNKNSKAFYLQGFCFSVSLNFLPFTISFFFFISLNKFDPTKFPSSINVSNRWQLDFV